MNKKIALAALATLALIVAGCGNKSGTTNEQAAPNAADKTEQSAQVSNTSDSYENAQLLVDVQWVEENAKDSKVKIIDVRKKGYEQGHIPGAVALDSGLLKDAANNSIIPADKFQELFQSLGVNSDTTVVLYDEGNSLYSGRVFYTLEFYGHKDKVKVLNGGYAAWIAASKDVSTEAPAVSKGDFTATANPDLVTTKEQIKKLDLASHVLLDVRSAKEYSGEDLRGNQKGGHIDKAINKEWSDSIEQNAEGVPLFKNANDLQTAFNDLGVDKSKTIVPYCQTNIRGAQAYFTLRLLGYNDVRPYEGAWAEWGNASDTEVVK